MARHYETHPQALAHFADCRAYQRHLRRGGEIFDNVQIGATLYTMDCYDWYGECITYGNKRTGLALRIDTANRYKSKRDALVYKYKAACWRNGIEYLD